VKAVVWHGRRDVRTETVKDPELSEPTDAIIRVTSTAICGSDLHLYEVLGAFMHPGDILGHEAMGIVEEVGSEVPHLAVGDRVVVPFNIACGSCWMCGHQLFAQCETTQVREHGSGAALFGYTELYGRVAGGQAEYVRVPQAHFGPIKLPDDADERFLFLSDVLPTAWQAVEYADVPKGGTVAVLGLGPIGQMSARIAAYHGATVYGVDLVDERLAMASRHGIEVIDRRRCENVAEELRERTDGRGPDSVIDAVGMEAHGSPFGAAAHRAVAALPRAAAKPLMKKAGIDRMSALLEALDIVRRGGTVSLSGVYGGMSDPLPMLSMFDKGIALRMGQAHVRRWTDEIIPLLHEPSDPLGVADLATHHVPLDDAASAYKMFQEKADGAIKVVMLP
jgi:threonine dehydrogenase-like Zn-dependent dehydrogenase